MNINLPKLNNAYRMLCFCLFFFWPTITWSSEILAPIYLLLFSHSNNQKIVIIGDSTVNLHSSSYLLNVRHMTCGDDNPQNLLKGWGDSLGMYVHNSENVINKARAGSSSVTFRTNEFYDQDNPDDVDKFGADRDWDSAKAEMAAAGSGILLIQFGTGNENNHVPVNDDDGNPIDYNGDGIINGDDEVARTALRKSHFDESIGIFIQEARALHFTPVLITPPDGRLDSNTPLADGQHPHTRGLFPGYIRDLGDLHNVEVLDLNARTNIEFAKYSDTTLLAQFGDCSFPSGSIDRVHYEPQGAAKVAGWVKELACSELTNPLLCKQFSTGIDRIIPTISLIGSFDMTILQGEVFVDPGATAHDDIGGNITDALLVTDTVNSDVVGEYQVIYNVADSSGNHAIPLTRTVHVASPGITVHEDAEDGNTDGWALYATTDGSSFTNVDDNGNRAIQLHGNDGLSNGFSLSNLNIDSGFVVSWRLNYSDDFRFFVQVNTADTDGIIYMEYTPADISTGLNGSFIHHGLGADVNNGEWHTFTRDIEADLNVIYPDDHITRIVGFSIRGSGLIDDISTSSRGVQETFSYNGHTYTIVKTPRSWQDASDAAAAAGGYLANIGSIAENHEIYSRLYRYIAQNEHANTDTTSVNGGEASYVWIGANDLDGEGMWVWQNNAQQFWSGGVEGNGEGGLFSNWGRDTDEVQSEPDDSNGQDTAAIALTRWPVNSGSLGQTSQWNDVLADTELYYIIEHE